MKWSECITVSLVLALASVPAYADGKQAGQSAGEMALGKLGSASGVRERIVNPLTSSSTPMTTLDGQRSFNAQLSCPSSDQYLTVIVQPTAGGDMQVSLSQDSDMDGAADYAYALPVVVSGVCANGVISCQPGTWNGCSHYAWSVDAGRVALSTTTLSALGGCYCINNSCGNNLVWNNLATVLKDIGGGAAGALQKVDPKYTVSDARIDGSAIFYYGQKGAECAGGPAGIGPERYYGNGGSISADTDTTVATQATDPMSNYSTLVNSVAASPANVQACTITRSVEYLSYEKDIGYDLRFYVGYDADGSSPECFWVGQDGACPMAQPMTDVWSCIGIGALSWQACKDLNISKINYIASRVVSNYNGAPPPAANYTCPGNPNPFSPDVVCLEIDVKDSYGTGTTPGCYGSENNNEHAFYTVWCYTDAREPGIEVVNEYPLLKQRWDTPVSPDPVQDHCQVVAGDPTCSLRTETVDGVTTWQNYMSTGLAPEASCRNIVGVYGTYSECRNWWLKERTYVCQSEGFDFTDANKRVTHIENTVADNNTTLYYQDYRNDGTGWVYEDNTVALPDRDPLMNCEKACKTRVPVVDTTATQAGTTAQNRVTTQRYDFYFRKCGDSGACTTELAGEEVIKGCECINEFAEAASLMSALELAGKDVICSSGTKQ